MTGFRHLSALFGLLALAACASAASIYHPASTTIKNSVGYTDSQINTGAYRVTFVAPQTVGAQGVQDLALLRAAEVTTAKGHTWFELLSTTTQEVQVERPKATFAQSAGNMQCNTASTNAGPGSVGCSYSFQDNSIAGSQLGAAGAYETRLVTTLSFIMGDGAMPSADHVYDAKATTDKIRATLK